MLFGACVLFYVRYSFSIPSQEIGLGNVSEITYFVLTGMQNLNSISKSLWKVLISNVICCLTHGAVNPEHSRLDYLFHSVFCVSWIFKETLKL